MANSYTAGPLRAKAQEAMRWRVVRALLECSGLQSRALECNDM